MEHQNQHSSSSIRDGDNAKVNLSRIGDMIEALPEYLRFQSIMDEDGKITKAKKNATTYGHPVTGNQIITKPKATSYEAALSIGRGLTAPILHFDEPEFTAFIDVIVKNSVSTFATAHDRSLKNVCNFIKNIYVHALNKT